MFSLRNEFRGLVVPSKFYSILAVGRPVVYEGDSRGEVARVIKEEHCGAVITPGDDREIERTLISYLNDPSRIVEDGLRARAAYNNRFRSSDLAQKYAAAIES